MSRLRICAAVVLSACAEEPFELWRGTVTKQPAIFSHADVRMIVQQQGLLRELLWTASWMNTPWGAVLDGDINMGMMTCRMPTEEKSSWNHTRGQHNLNSTLPCRHEGPEELAPGEENVIVRMMSAMAVALGATKVFMAGLGPGTMATYWQQYHPEITDIDVAELSPSVVGAAIKFFGLRPDARLRVHVGDGMDILANASKFDVFVHDATGSMHKFLTPSALKLIHDKSDAGAMIMNINGLPQVMKPLLLVYLRCFFNYVYLLDPVAVALWRPAALTLEGAPLHVKRWANLDAWSFLNGFTTSVIHWFCWCTVVVVIAMMFIVRCYQLHRQGWAGQEGDVLTKHQYHLQYGAA